MDLLTNSSVPYLSKVMDVLSQRHRVIANNIANVNTPKYRAKDIAFKKIIQKFIKAKQGSSNMEEYENQINKIQAEVFLRNKGNVNSGDNDVDLDTEMAGLSANTLMFKTYAQILKAKLKQIKIAINDKV
ncbi:MAG: flagellar basal body rod protein FlgB [Candidatus Omnitrophota bacterium]|nr:MAG: flagellar basal body rod protein FlgB [Candidatus Omnitrophota bacterium]